MEKTLRYATRGIPSWKEFASVFIERYVVIPRPTRAGAIDNFIQNDAHDKTTHFYGFRIEFRSTSIFLSDQVAYILKTAIGINDGKKAYVI